MMAEVDTEGCLALEYYRMLFFVGRAAQMK